MQRGSPKPTKDKEEQARPKTDSPGPDRARPATTAHLPPVDLASISSFAKLRPETRDILTEQQIKQREKQIRDKRVQDNIEREAALKQVQADREKELARRHAEKERARVERAKATVTPTDPASPVLQSHRLKISTPAASRPIPQPSQPAPDVDRLDPAFDGENLRKRQLTALARRYKPNTPTPQASAGSSSGSSPEEESGSQEAQTLALQVLARRRGISLRQPESQSSTRSTSPSSSPRLENPDSQARAQQFGLRPPTPQTPQPAALPPIAGAQPATAERHLPAPTPLRGPTSLRGKKGSPPETQTPTGNEAERRKEQDMQRQFTPKQPSRSRLAVRGTTGTQSASSSPTLSGRRQPHFLDSPRTTVTFTPPASEQPPAPDSPRPEETRRGRLEVSPAGPPPSANVTPRQQGSAPERDIPRSKSRSPR